MNAKPVEVAAQHRKPSFGHKNDLSHSACAQDIGRFKRLLVICGPTASGKTGLAIDLAERFGGEIIGADSMQVYKGMDIGTAKPTISEMRGIPHHLIDFLEPHEDFSVAAYVALAKKHIADITARGRLPVVCGGTGLYISSLVDNIGFDEIETDPKLREHLKQLADEQGAEALHKQLIDCDPQLAAKLHPNNLGRVIRALEVFELTGKTMTELQANSRQQPSEYDLCMLGIRYNDRQKLYDRIDRRVDLMLENGLLDEAKPLFDAGFGGTAAQAIGYKELQTYLAGGETLAEAAGSIKRETRRYAKRQLTWLRRDARIQWLNADDGYPAMWMQAMRITERFLNQEKDGDVT